MTDNYNEDDLIRGINENMSFVKNIPLNDADKCAGSIRSTLEYAVKLFWLKKYDKKPVWIKGYIESFDLHKAISDDRFSQYFSKMTLSYMHTIRQTCNGVLHDNDPLTLDEVKDLLTMLEKSVKAIENAIPMEIMISPIKELDETATADFNTRMVNTMDKPQHKLTDNTIIASNIGKSSVSKSSSVSFLGHSSVKGKSYDINSERTLFWEMLQEALDNNGNPFTIATRAQYGTVNRKSPNCNLCLGFDFLLQKEKFRIGIYIQDDTETPCFDRLLQQKKEIESLLGFSPQWTTKGVKKPETRRIEIFLPFTPYDREDYQRLIDEALPIFIQYIKVFSKYLPEAFKD